MGEFLLFAFSVEEGLSNEVIVMTKIRKGRLKMVILDLRYIIEKFQGVELSISRL